MTPENEEITKYDTPGELVVRGPSVVLGYLNNEKATKETFEDGWMRTGDEAVVRLSPKGIEHVFIVDRIKELIKVKVRVTSLLVVISALTRPRVCRSLPPSWRLTSWPILPSQMLLSLPFPTTALERFPRLLL